MRYRVEVYFWERSSDGDDWIDSVYSKMFDTRITADEYAEFSRNVKDVISVEIFEVE
ncbi:hypothetical protein UFOVP787_72 [uncultured Caudovirales phage]|uniref:Uncharacterized protein n=1 Tax=uncultured Caudovirales phage TaxID=2100421 RepID=A0A6J5P0B4_9CAUD|nr:hypothetical protein UFOVP787_72 [uncultured Caudovirales phage]